MKDLRVAIVGGGGTGAAIAHDFALRGINASLYERGELTSGTTGRHHGQLHSGARYVVGDPALAAECIREVRILNRIAPQSIEFNYGLLIALDDRDEEYGESFVEACAFAGLPIRRLEISEAITHEPAINPDARYAILVPDGTIDAYRLPMQFFATAKRNGAKIHNFTEVMGIDVDSGRVTGLQLFDYRNRKEVHVDADIVVNAAGPWSGLVAQKAGVDIDITPAPGTMVAIKGRICNMIISHLHPSGDGDIVVPQRNLSIIGSTQQDSDLSDGVAPLLKDIEWLVERANDLVPGFSNQPFHAAWTAIRPLAGKSVSGREISRNHETVRHPEVRGFYTVIGGKATLLRAMAEVAVDKICDDLGITTTHRSATHPLDQFQDYFRGNA